MKDSIKRNKGLFIYLLLNVLAAFYGLVCAQNQGDWDATIILRDMDKSWSVGNGCLELNRKTVNVCDGIELNGNVLEIMDATIQVIGGDVTNFGESVNIDDSELIIYKCSTSDLVIYNEVLSVDDSDIYNVRLYPNPASSYINIDVIDLDSYMIYDTKGYLIASGVSRSVDVSYLSEGIYFIRVSHSYKFKVLRFIKK